MHDLCSIKRHSIKAMLHSTAVHVRAEDTGDVRFTSDQLSHSISTHSKVTGKFGYRDKAVRGKQPTRPIITAQTKNTHHIRYFPFVGALHVGRGGDKVRVEWNRSQSKILLHSTPGGLQFKASCTNQLKHDLANTED